MSWKEIAKRAPIIYSMNAKFKCLKLKHDRRRIERAYDDRIQRERFVYSDEEAVKQFRAHLSALNPDFSPKIKGDLNFFWVGASQSQDESGTLQSLRRFGKVTVFRRRDGGYGPLFASTPAAAKMTIRQRRDANDAALLDALTQALAFGRIDVLMGQLWAQFYSASVLHKIRSLGIVVIVIAMDDRLPEHWERVDGIRMGVIGLAPAVDMVLTTAPEACAWYGVEGHASRFWPLASDGDMFHSDDDHARDIDVLFIGNRYGIRGEIVRYLTRHGVKVECFGRGWPNGHVDAEQNCALSRRARIILGVGTVGHCRDVYTLKLRDFDAVMSGALYITHRNPDLLRLFTEGSEIECYDTAVEACRKIQHYLRNPIERIRIGKAGQTVARASHTWDQRFSETFTKLGLLMQCNAG
jgi:spore maturation protein CgeB